MLISKLGEFALIERFRRRIRNSASVIKGSGDDCAVLPFNRKYYQLFTCDMMVEGVDFSSRDDPYLIGRKAMAISVSDIAACAGVPEYALVCFGLSSGCSVHFAERLFQGARDLARRYRIDIVGGDLSRARCLVLETSILGKVEKKKLVLRSGARVGDLLFVTGGLGGSIKGRHLRFTPRLAEARFLVDNFKVHSMIDISDGLLQDLGHILKASRVGAVLYEGLIPLSKDARGINDALSGGEDFELLFSLGRKDAGRLRGRRPEFKLIGQIIPPAYGLQLVDAKGRLRQIKKNGYDHFRKKTII